MVEVEVRKAETKTEPAQTTKLDINEIIGKVRSFVDGIREMSAGGEPMAVTVDAFNFSVGKADEEYDLTMNLNLTLKPKETEEAKEAKPATGYEPI
jgi:hypothetical protein